MAVKTGCLAVLDQLVTSSRPDLQAHAEIVPVSLSASGYQADVKSCSRSRYEGYRLVSTRNRTLHPGSYKALIILSRGAEKLFSSSRSTTFVLRLTLLLSL